MLLGTNQPIEVQVFNLWFMATEFPSDASDVNRDAAMDRIRSIDALFPGLSAAGPEEQLARARRLLADAIANPNMTSGRLPDRLGKSEALINWLDRQIDGLSIAANDRHRMAAGCLDAAMEYHKAIVVLIANRLYGSAMAMVRPAFEAYLRGAWLHQCADDKSLEQFSKDALALKPGRMISDLERLPSFDCGTLLKAKRAGWSKMCGFTHTGIQQAIRRNTQESIEPDYDEAELLEALGFSDAMGLMCAIEIAHIANNTELAQRVLEKVNAF